MQYEEEKRKALLDLAEGLCSASNNIGALLDRFWVSLLLDIADSFSIDLVEDDGSIRNYITRHVEPRNEQLLRELRLRHPLASTASYGYPRVIKTGKPQFIPGVSTRLAERLLPGEEASPAAKAIVVRSYICVPLIAHSRTLGAMTVTITEHPNAFSAGDLLTLEALAEKLAECLDSHLSR